METLIYIPLLLLAIAPAFYGMVQYNALIALRRDLRASWNAVDLELHRRYELIPVLLETIRPDPPRDPDAALKLAETREQCVLNRGPVSSQARTQLQFVEALAVVLARIEVEPAPEVRRIREEFVDAEDRIQAALQRYNEKVRVYRTKRETFPSSIIARLFAFPVIADFAVSRAVASLPE